MAERKRKGFILAGLAAILPLAALHAAEDPVIAASLRDHHRKRLVRQIEIEEIKIGRAPSRGAIEVELDVRRRWEGREAHLAPAMLIQDGETGAVLVGDETGVVLDLEVSPEALTDTLMSVRLRSGDDPRGVRVLARPGQERRVKIPSLGELEVGLVARPL